MTTYEYMIKSSKLIDDLDKENERLWEENDKLKSQIKKLVDAINENSIDLTEFKSYCLNLFNPV